MEIRKTTTLAGPDVPSPTFKVVIEQGRQDVSGQTPAGTVLQASSWQGSQPRQSPALDRSWWVEGEDSPTHLQLPRG